jgi:hypothetical protein
VCRPVHIANASARARVDSKSLLWSKSRAWMQCCAPYVAQALVTRLKPDPHLLTSPE